MQVSALPAKSNPEKERAAIPLLKKGHTAVYVGAHKNVGVHPTTVQRWARKHGIELKYPHNRHDERVDLVNTAEILRLRKRKHGGKPLFTYEEIAGLCDCSRSYVSKVLTTAREEGKL